MPPFEETPSALSSALRIKRADIILTSKDRYNNLNAWCPRFSTLCTRKHKVDNRGRSDKSIEVTFAFSYAVARYKERPLTRRIDDARHA